MKNESQNDQVASEPDTSSSSGRSMVVVLVLVALGIAVAMLVPIPFKGRAPKAIGDLVHAPFYGAATLLILIMLQRFAPVKWGTRILASRIVVIAILMIVFGIMMELGQAFIQRSPSVHDAVANALGIVAACLGFTTWMAGRAGRLNRWIRGGLYVVAIVLIAISWRSPLAVLHDCYLVQLDFPMLGSFESKQEIGRWYQRHALLELSDSKVTHGKTCARITSQNARECGITMIEMPTDWSGMKSLELDVTLENQPAPDDNLRLLVRVVDGFHAENQISGPSRTISMTAGQQQHISIPVQALKSSPSSDRPFDFTDIRYLDVWMLHAEVGTTILLDNVHVKF